VNIFRKAGDLLSNLLNFGGGSGGFFFMGMPTAAGKIVTPDTAIQVAAVWASLKILGEAQGSLPLNVFERVGETGKTKASNHPLQSLLHDEPNPEMSAMDYRMSQTISLGIWGNAYSRIARNGNRIAALWPLPTNKVKSQRNSAGDLFYEYTPPVGPVQSLAARDVLHVRGMSMDGINGLSPIMTGRNALGLSMALEEFAGRFFSNGGIPQVILEHPGSLSDTAKRNIRDDWKRMFGGVERSNDVAVTEEGMNVNVVGVTPDKAQSLESRRFQIGEVARMYRIPPHMLADLERATFANIEQLSLEFVIFTLTPWLVMWEQAIERTLLAREEKGKYFVEHNVDGLLRGDIASRYSAYMIGRQGGWLNADEIRGLENMNPIGGEAGTSYLTPLNMTDANSVPKPALKSLQEILLYAQQGKRAA
jgi:HK97 family phage portal protein